MSGVWLLLLLSCRYPMNDEMAGNLVGGHYYYSAAVTPVAHVLFVELYVQSRRHVQLYAYFATAVEAAKAFDGAVRRTIEVHKNLSYSGPLSDKQGYMFRAMLQIINFPTTEEKAFMRNYEQNWRRKPFELRLEDSESPRSRRRMRENRTSSAVKAKRRMSRRITASQRHPPCTSFARMLLLTSRRRRKREKA